MPELAHLSASKTFSHGIHPEEHKELTSARPVRRLPFAPHYIVLMAQHLGKPALPVVRKGQEVIRGELIARADGFVSVPMHAPVTGVVTEVGRSLDCDGRMVPSITLRPYPGATQEVLAGEPRTLENLSGQEIVAGIQAMGMVGLGGAAFPTHVKLSPPKGKTVNDLIINGCECEPYLTSDHRVMLEQGEAILLGTSLVQKALGAKRAVLAIEDNKPDALAEFSRLVPPGSAITVAAVKTKYPQGAEKMLTRALLHMDIPSGGLPADIGVVVSNVATVGEVGTLLPRGQGLIERVVTVTGHGIDRPGNYLVPLGTPLDFLLEQVGFNGSARQVLFGGPMMGKSVAFLDTPVTKGVSGIVVLAEDEISPPRKTYPCIRCGECVTACPIHLNPSRLGLLARNSRFEEMASSYNLMDCFECGSCAYVCPSNIPLVQLFRLSKGILRERSTKR